jgi:hypothetical protein
MLDWLQTVCCCLWPLGKCEPTAANQYILRNILFDDVALHNFSRETWDFDVQILAPDFCAFAPPFKD